MKHEVEVRDFAHEERIEIERLRRFWELGAAAVLNHNTRVILERVGPGLDGLEAPEFGRRVEEINAQMIAAGVDPMDSYSRLKAKERRRKETSANGTQLKRDVVPTR